MTTIKIKTITTGSWIKIQIVSVTDGFSQELQNGKWVNTSEKPELFEDEILTFGKYFFNTEEAAKFMQTKSFKYIFSSIVKNWK